MNKNLVPEWAKKAVWYQIFPERYRKNVSKDNDKYFKYISHGKEISDWSMKSWGRDWYDVDDWEKNNFKSVFGSIDYRRYGGDLSGVYDKVSYLKELGVNALYLTPVFWAKSSHKYDAKYFHHIDPFLGPDPLKDIKDVLEAQETEDPKTWIWTEADKFFLKLIKKLHANNIRIILDGVFNHTGRDFFAFEDLIKNQRNSKYRTWYKKGKWNSNNRDGFDYKGWFGHKDLPEFRRQKNNLNTGVKQYIFDSVKRWMCPFDDKQAGIDGWRLDVAYMLPHNFLKDFRLIVKKYNEQAFISGEIFDFGVDFLKGDELDSIMNYQFAYSCIEFFAYKKEKLVPSEFSRKLSELLHKSSYDVDLVKHNLIDSHDTARLRTLINNPDKKYSSSKFFAKSKFKNSPELNIERGDEKTDEIQRLIFFFQCVFVGAPMIYYGDEVAMWGANDPDCRKPMLWDDIKYENEVITPFGKKKNEKVFPDMKMFEYYKQMIQIRKKFESLQKGKFIQCFEDDINQIFGFYRIYKDEKTLILINNSSKTCRISMNIKAGTILNIFTNHEQQIKKGKFDCLLERKSGNIFLIKK